MTLEEEEAELYLRAGHAPDEPSWMHCLILAQWVTLRHVDPCMVWHSQPG